MRKEKKKGTTKFCSKTMCTRSKQANKQTLNIPFYLSMHVFVYYYNPNQEGKSFFLSEVTQISFTFTQDSGEVHTPVVRKRHRMHEKTHRRLLFFYINNNNKFAILQVWLNWIGLRRNILWIWCRALKKRFSIFFSVFQLRLYYEDDNIFVAGELFFIPTVVCLFFRQQSIHKAVPYS